MSDAVAAYMRLGWSVHDGDGRVDLVCGNGIEALEVPRPTGVVAVQWWLHTGGAPDEIRRLPALPGPQDALAVIAAGDRYLFLVQAGACPWAGGREKRSRNRQGPRSGAAGRAELPEGL